MDCECVWVRGSVCARVLCFVPRLRPLELQPRGLSRHEGQSKTNGWKGCVADQTLPHATHNTATLCLQVDVCGGLLALLGSLLLEGQLMAQLRPAEEAKRRETG